MLIESKKKISELRSKILENTRKTYQYIVQVIGDCSPIGLFADIKFNKVGFDPIDGTPLNFIEQLNQMFSDLVVLYAVEELLSKYPDKHFDINLGAKAGFDIQSVDKTVVAECFAVTTVGSNNKLRKDAKKLMDLAPNQEKYIFFYSEYDTKEKLEETYASFTEIMFGKIDKDYFLAV